jgi:hypothetical protein
MALLKKKADEFERVHKGSVVGHIDTFRHDSWQLVIQRPALALRAAVFLRSAIKMLADARTKYDTRISIGIGGVEFLSKQRISDSRGPAFTKSGKGLDTMDGRCLVFVAEGEPAAVWQWIGHAVTPLLDCVVSDWTPTESRAVYGALKGWTQEETAKNWKIDNDNGVRPTRQAVTASLDRAHWNTVESILVWVEKTVGQTLEFA